MFKGSVKKAPNIQQPFGYISVDQEFQAQCGGQNDVAFNSNEVICGSQLNKRDIVEFGIKSCRSGKFVAIQVRFVQRAADLPRKVIREEFQNSPAQANSSASASANGEQIFRRTSSKAKLNLTIADINLDVDEDDSEQEEEATMRNSTPSISMRNSKRLKEVSKFNRKPPRIPEEQLLGKIVLFGENGRAIKPDKELPEGYRKGSRVFFNPLYLKSGQLSVLKGDRVSYTLGTDDKSHPMLLRGHLIRGKPRNSEVINKHLEKIHRIFNGNYEDIRTCRSNEANSEDFSLIKDCVLDILTCCAMWETIGNSPNLSRNTMTLLVDTVLEADMKSSSMRRSFAGLLDALIKTKMFHPRIGQFRAYIEYLVTSSNQSELQKVRRFLLLVLQNVPERANTVVSLIKLMLPQDQDSLEYFMYLAMKEIAKQTVSDGDDLEWNDMALVPTITELTEVHEEYFSSLRPVVEKGQYASSQEYLDIYFRLLRADCFGSICKCVQKLCTGKLDHKDMNVYHPVKINGIIVTHADIGIVMKMTSCVPVDNWAKTSKLMYGNLLCISPSGNFKDVIWATIANRDINMISNKQNKLISIELCTWRNKETDSEALIRMCAAGESMVAVESPTYYNAYRPVLESLQFLNPEELPFQSELIEAKPNDSLPEYIASFGAKYSVSPNSNGNSNNMEPIFSALRSFWPPTIDKYQEDALRHIFSHRLAFVQGPPGTGKSFIGVAAVKTILNMSTRPKGPILVLTYKNHALDEFLKDLLKSFPDGVIRVGGRSKEDELVNCNLNVIKKTLKDPPLQRTIWDKRTEIDQSILLVKDSIKRLQNSLRCSEESLEQYLSTEQIRNFIFDSKVQNVDGYNKNKFVHELQASNGTEFLSEKQLGFLRRVFNNWLPRTVHSRIVPKYILDFKVKVNNQNAAHTAEVDDNDSEDSEDSLDEEDIKEMEEERFTCVTRSTKRKEEQEIQELKITGDAAVLFKYLDAVEDSDDDRLLSVPNLWKLDEFNRRRLVELLLMRQVSSPMKSFQAAIQYHEQLCSEKKELENQHKINIMLNSKIIGMTMTGASLNADLIRAVKPAIIVIEEAAEVLEPHIISVLGNWVQHLIMIGDHKQLRPPVESYELVTKYHFDVSMMERLVNNEIPYKSLAKQNRMRPEFAKLLKDIYPELEDGDRVNQNEPPNCIEKSMFFWDHEEPEEYSRSYTNPGEVNRVAKLALFLVQQGYHPNKITILGAYRGQTTLLKRKLGEAVNKWKDIFEKYTTESNANKWKDIFEKYTTESNAQSDRDRKRLFNVSTIDMYQGDENDIVIVSLVRSNNRSRVGFLDMQNRRCVAQSRAKCGMYFCGNTRTLSANEDWATMINKMREDDCVGSTLTLCCPKHPETKLFAQSEDHITLQSFCSVICLDVMRCGLHSCRKTCQPPHDHSRCRVQIEFKFKRCGHPSKRECHQDENDIPCKRPCPFLMDCKQHICPERCSPDHNHIFCTSKVLFTCSSCGNENDKMCSQLEGDVRCEHNVEVPHPTCGHLNTKKCYEPIDKCKASCERNFPDCGHPCHLKCGDVCNSKACKICKELRELERKREEEKKRAEKEKSLEEISRELEEIKEKYKNMEEVGVNFIKLDKDNNDEVLEYNKVKDLAEKFIQPKHGIAIQVMGVEKIVNHKLRSAYLSCFKKLIDPTVVELKFHGTSLEGVDGICKEGFRLPQNAGMFGKGVYFATDSSKSEYYARDSNILLLCEVALGKSMVVETGRNTMNLAKLLEKGYDSLYAKRGTRETGGVRYDEFVVYRPEQAIPKYLIKYQVTRPEERNSAENVVPAARDD